MFPILFSLWLSIVIDVDPRLPQPATNHQEPIKARRLPVIVKSTVGISQEPGTCPSTTHQGSVMTGARWDDDCKARSDLAGLHFNLNISLSKFFTNKTSAKPVKMGGFQAIPPPQYEMQSPLCTRRHKDHNSSSRKSTDSTTNPALDSQSHWEPLPFYSSSVEDLDSNWETDSNSSDFDDYSYSSNSDKESGTQVCCNCHKSKEMDLEAQEEIPGGDGQEDGCCSWYDVSVTVLFMLLVFLMACGFVWVLKH